MPTHRPLTQSELNWYHAHTNWMAGQPPAGHNPNKYDWFNLMNRMSIPTAPTQTVRSNGQAGPSRMSVSNITNVMNTANSSSTKSNSSSKNRPIQKRYRTTSQSISTDQAAPRRTRVNTSRNSAMPAASIQTINTMMR